LDTRSVGRLEFTFGFLENIRKLEGNNFKSKLVKYGLQQQLSELLRRILQIWKLGVKLFLGSTEELDLLR
jgi:hypothetical protein